MLQPTIKDVAEYCRLSVEAGVLRESDVVDWADEMITRIDTQLPDWLLELSTNKERTMAQLLADVPGDIDRTYVWNLVLAGIGRSARIGKQSLEQVVHLLYRWACSGELPDEHRSDAYRMDTELDGVLSGWASRLEFEKIADEFFERFRQFEDLIPSKNRQTAQ